MINSRKLRWSGYVASIIYKLTGKRPLGRPRHRLEDKIRIVFNVPVRGVGLILFTIGIIGELESHSLSSLQEGFVLMTFTF